METDSRTGTAMVFPGMGPSRFEDLAKFLLINPLARKLVASADDILGYSLLDRYRDTAGDYSEYAQIAFLVTCLAMARWSEETLGARPEVCAGPSFGGKAAAAYSGALTFPEAVLLTARLARCEEEYFAREHRDVVTQSFVRMPEDRLAGVLRELAEQGEWYDMSCYIDDDFFMVSLREGRLEWFQRRLRASGGFPLYTMRPPMHSAAFAPLRDRVERAVVADLRFADPSIPVIADQDGALLNSADGVRTMLLDGFVRPVRWPAVVATLQRLRIGTLYVAGPDSIFGRVGCTNRRFDVVAANPRLALQPQRRPAAAATA
jgi:[acyl-carrier-protein] S-malonyltransferase